MTVTDTWLGDGAVLASIHVPDSDASTTGVVICPGMGQEHVISYRTLRLLAQELEAGGVGSVRYNHVGHGDSTSTGPVPPLLEGARLAAAALRVAGFSRIAYVGLASGALVAAAAAHEDPQSTGLVLWDPPESGKRWLRRARSLYATSVDDARTPAAGTGHVTIVGLELEADEVADFTALHYDDEVADRMPVLLALREGAGGRSPAAFDGREPHAFLPGSPREPGTPETIRVADHENLLDVSSVVAKIPGASVEGVAAWVLDRLVVARSAETLGAASAAASVEFDFTPETATAAVRLEERLVRIGPDRLFAIETRPAGAADDVPGMVLQAGSAEHRIGATRHQVTLARELAARGLRVVRLDRRGTGETDVVRADEPNLLYAREWLEDNDNAVRYLELPPQRVGVTGLCSGGWLALMTDPGLAHLIIGIGVGTFQTTTEAPNQVADSAPRVTGETGPGRTPLAAVVKSHMPYWGMRILARLNKVNIAQPLLQRLLAANTEVVLLMTPADQEVFADRLGDKAVEHLASRGGDLTLVTFDRGDHALFESEIRDDVIRSVVEQTVRVFGSETAARVAGTTPTAV